MSFTILFEEEGFSTDIPKLMGRNAAGASFLDGLFRHASTRQFTGLVRSAQAAQAFKDKLSRISQEATSSVFSSVDLNQLGVSGGLFYPGPGIATSSFHRLSTCGSHDRWALCGITHTTSSANAMSAITEWITAPVQPWDAVVCTSSAVKRNVEIVLQAEVDALRERLGITKILLPQLPVIPLGVDTDRFTFSSHQRVAARKRLDCGDEALVVLYVGRLSFHAKAHPLAMYQALADAARVTSKEIVLVECGWHANDFIETAFIEAAKLTCPSVRVVTLDGRVPEDRETAWASADVFCSLSDNIQETFGITPVEAMAAGLPVVVTDWDGYRDTVRDGVDGFRIPTLAPPPGSAGDLAHRHALELDSYDMYCGHCSTLVAVASERLRQAFVDLFQSPELRKKMGEAGKKRATQEYDWRRIIPRYEELWDEQTKMRLSAKKAREEQAASGRASTLPVWPARLDPTVAFAHYPTQHLTLSTQLTLTEPTAADALSTLADYQKLSMVNYAAYMFPTESELQSVFKCAEEHLPNSCTAEGLLRDIEVSRRPYVMRSLCWLCKLGLLSFL